MSLPLEDMTSLSTAMVSRDLSLLNDSLIVIVSPSQWQDCGVYMKLRGTWRKTNPASFRSSRWEEKAAIAVVVVLKDGGCDISSDP